MSGTLRALREARKQWDEQQRKSLLETQKEKYLKENRQRVIAQVCKLFGWSKLDDFAQKMLDETFAGQIVDIKKLKQDIQKWKEQQSDSSEGEQE